MKEYDIFLREPPEGEIIVSMLPYYAGFSPQNGLLLDVSAHERALKKLRVSSHIGIHPDVSSTKKRAFERSNHRICIALSPVFSEKKSLGRVNPNAICIQIHSLNVVSTLFLGNAENPIKISQSLSDTKHGFERASVGPVVHAGIAEIAELKFEQCDNKISIAPLVGSLAYKDITFNGSSAVQQTVSVNVSLNRRRPLAEVDSINGNGYSALADIDNMTLEELDNITLD